MGMREKAFPARLTTEEGIRDVVRELELSEWRRTFRGDSEGKLEPALLESHAKEVADCRIEQLVEGHGSLTGALGADTRLLDQLTAFESENQFLQKLT